MLRRPARPQRASLPRLCDTIPQPTESCCRVNLCRMEKAAAARDRSNAATAAATAASQEFVPSSAAAVAAHSNEADRPIMYCKKCKKTGPSPGTCDCPIFMKTSKLPGSAGAKSAAAEAPTAGGAGWQAERKARLEARASGGGGDGGQKEEEERQARLARQREREAAEEQARAKASVRTVHPSRLF